MRHSLATVALIIAMVLPAQAFANETTLKFDDIRSQQAEIRKGVETRTGRYKDMSGETRMELMRRQNEVLATIEGKQSPGELNPDQRTTVFNHLEWIEAAINHTEDERLVCERVKTIGSNRVQRVCKTEAQIREEREQARRTLDHRNIQWER